MQSGTRRSLVVTPPSSGFPSNGRWMVWQDYTAGGIKGRYIFAEHPNPIALLQAVRTKLGLRVDDHPIGRLR